MTAWVKRAVLLVWGACLTALVWFPLRVDPAHGRTWGVVHDAAVALAWLGALVGASRWRRGSFQREAPLVYLAVAMLSVVPLVTVPTLGWGYARMQWVTLMTFGAVFLCAWASTRVSRSGAIPLLVAWGSWAMVSAVRSLVAAATRGTPHDAVDIMGHTNSRAGFELGWMAFLLGVAASGFRPGLVLPVAGIVGLSLLVSLSRGAWLGAAAVVVFVAAARWGWRKAGLATLAIAGAMALAPGGIGQRARSVLDPQWSTNSFRLKVWKAALEGVLARPMQGVGYDTAWFFLTPRLEGEVVVLAGKHVHNLALQTWMETGLLGLAALAVTFFSAFRVAARWMRGATWLRPLGWGIAAWLVAVVAHGLVDCTWRDYGQQVVFWAWMGWARGREELS